MSETPSNLTADERTLWEATEQDCQAIVLARNAIRPLLEEIDRLRGALMQIKNWRQEGQMVIFEDLVEIAREALEENP